MRKTRKEDLMEGECACGEVSCTSAECQAMAPAKVVSPAYYSGNKKKALGKKDKYNKLGEKNLKEWRASSAAEGLGWVDSELDTIETNLSVLEDFIGAVCDPNDEIFNNINAIHSSINYIRNDCINFKESVNLKENGEGAVTAEELIHDNLESIEDYISSAFRKDFEEKYQVLFKGENPEDALENFFGDKIVNTILKVDPDFWEEAEKALQKDLDKNPYSAKLEYSDNIKDYLKVAKRFNHLVQDTWDDLIDVYYEQQNE